MKKINLNINGCKFKLSFNELKEKFILKTPTSNNTEFKDLKDVMKFLESYYPKFVVNQFKKIHINKW